MEIDETELVGKFQGPTLKVARYRVREKMEAKDVSEAKCNPGMKRRRKI